MDVALSLVDAVVCCSHPDELLQQVSVVSAQVPASLPPAVG